MSLYFLSTDGDAHWYMIPAEHRREWNEWRNLSDDDERGWTVPSYANPLGGGPQQVEFELPDTALRARVAALEGEGATLRKAASDHLSAVKAWNSHKASCEPCSSWWFTNAQQCDEGKPLQTIANNAAKALRRALDPEAGG